MEDSVLLVKKLDGQLLLVPPYLNAWELAMDVSSKS
jgi:hypothetical protein